MTLQSCSPLSAMTRHELIRELDVRLSAARELEAQLIEMTERCETARRAVAEVFSLLSTPPLLEMMEVGDA